jgi:hypothetical protein
VIWFLWAKHLSAIEIHRRLVEVYGDGAVREQHVRKWRTDFENNRKDIHLDCTRSASHTEDGFERSTCGRTDFGQMKQKVGRSTIGHS